MTAVVNMLEKFAGKAIHPEAIVPGGFSKPMNRREQEGLTTLAAAVLEMSGKGLGLTAVLHPDGTVAGIFTDGDLRRCQVSGG